MPEVHKPGKFCGSKSNILMANLIFAIVMLHLVIGFGYALYKISSAGAPKKDNHKL
jgi:hypothetical protein